MAKKKKEEPKVDNEVGKLNVKEKTEKQPDGNETKGDVTKVKEKMRMKPQVVEQTITKVDLSKPSKTDKVEDEVKVESVVEEVVEEVAPAQEDEKKIETDGVEEAPEEIPTIEEVTDEEVEEAQEQIEEAVAEAEATGKSIPENIQKLMDFMEETGGDLNDYIKLNRDYSNVDDQDLLFEHYKQTKPHLTNEEINFLMEDQFSYDEEVDDERDIKRKKLALKEQVASAKSQLEENKSKYYKDIKAGSKLTPEQQKAIDFFNRYNEESEKNNKAAEAAKSTFLQKTDNVFNDKFKGFEYNVGDKKFRFNVKDAKDVKETQSDINNFVKKFLNKKNLMEDAKGYHKSLYTAMNADAVANHFYEQGKADAIKDSVAKAKNVNMDPRQSHGEIEAGGIKVRVLGDNSSDFKFKIKQK
jgi:hypothetical protein